MYNYRYDLISADIDYHIKKHPQTDLSEKGYKWIKCEPFSIADCWIFRFEHELKNPPPYLQRISDDFTFSDEKENTHNSIFKEVWKEIKKEYFKRHPEAGLTWWNLPIDEQPLEFKAYMYDIFWDLMNK